jgi:hypothetical protein
MDVGQFVTMGTPKKWKNILKVDTNVVCVYVLGLRLCVSVKNLKKKRIKNK